MTRLPRILLDHLALAIFASALVVSAVAQSGPIVSHELYRDISSPVREYASSSPATGPFQVFERPRPMRRPLPGPVPAGPDAAEQTFNSSPRQCHPQVRLRGHSQRSQWHSGWRSFR